MFFHSKSAQGNCKCRIITIRGLDNLVASEEGVYEHSESGARFYGSASYDKNKDTWIINLDG